MQPFTLGWRGRRMISTTIISLLSATTVAVITEGSTARTSPRTSFCRPDGVSLIAHRGTGPGTRRIGTRPYTEDTLPAFEQAMRLGADGFETDYWPTRDGRIVSNHDATLDRTTNGTGTIASRRMAYVRRLTTPSGSGLATVATIERAMAWYGGLRQQEIKQGSEFSDRQLAWLIELDGRYADLADVLVTSSELETLRRIHSLDPRIGTGYIARSPKERPSATQLPTWLKVVLVDLAAADASYARAIHRAGYLLSLRGVDSVSQLHQAAALGADRIVTDHPETFAATC